VQGVGSEAQRGKEAVGTQGRQLPRPGSTIGTGPQSEESPKGRCYNLEAVSVQLFVGFIPRSGSQEFVIA